MIDRRYRLNEVPEALRYLGEGHAKGKIVVIREWPLPIFTGALVPSP